jgi:uncharacterized NAD(P)/FAD-binding protein YdhS
MKSHRAVSIAIIGGGAAGASVAHYLVRSLGNGPVKVDAEIKLYEKRGVIGPGLAYQRDNDVLLMNMVSQDASLFADEPENFWRWLASTEQNQYRHYAISGSAIIPNGYVPRGLFGCYMRHMFEQVITLAALSGIKLSKHHTEVVGLQKLGERYELMTATGETSSFDYVILCTGNTKPVDIYSLSGHARYINEPYPVQPYLGKIGPHDRVAVIGTQLTAVDVAIVLAHQGHQGPIHLVSRTRELPSIRSILEPYQLKYMTIPNLRALREKGHGEVRLQDILRLLRKEFAAVGADWKEVLFRYKDSIEPDEYFAIGLNNAPKKQPWQWVMVAIDHVVEHFWDALNDHDKTIFMKIYHRNWNSRRAPLPVPTAYKIHSLLCSGQLKFKSGVSDIKVTNQGLFQVTYTQNSGSQTSSSADEFDWVINATGPAREVDENQASIVNDLLNDGSAIKHPHGGIQVEFESSAVIDANGIPNRKLYAIGQLACGTYYFVSSLEMISLRSREVAHNVVQHILRSPRYATESSMLPYDVQAQSIVNTSAIAYAAE